MLKEINKYFNKHLKEVNESYSEHFAQAFGYALLMFIGSIFCLIHAIFPFLFTNTASSFSDLICKHKNSRCSSKVE